MRIKELIEAKPLDPAITRAGQGVGAVAKGVGAVAGGIAAAPARAVAGYRKGAAAVDKFLDPSKWFGGNDTPTKKAAPVAAAEPAAQEKSTALNADSVVQTLDLVTRGSQLVSSDITLLKTLRSNVKNNMYDTDNPDAVAQALKTVIGGQQLNSKQISTLQQFSTLF
jgi:hypothetical protein